ncbi:MAG TPA: tetratricopeptide repeat protein [Rhizomicrobium sp.]|nr:tetratricopeptide repeat protein [Rhizomicrobium sp.]
MIWLLVAIVTLLVLMPGERAQAQSDLSSQFSSHYAAGLRDMRSGKQEDALQEFTEAIAARPDAQAYAMRGITNAFLKKYSPAIADFNEAISLDPNVDAVIYFDRAKAEQNNHLPEKARADLDIVIKNAGGNLELLRGAYSLEKRYTEALKIDNELISQDPTNPWNWDGRCLSRAMVNSPEEALPDCDQAISLRSNAVNLYVDRGVVRLKAGHLNDALSDFTVALRLEPKSSAAMFGIGTVETRLGNASDGAAKIAEAKQINADIENEVPLNPW